MFSPLTLGSLALFYVAVLFVLAYWGDRRWGQNNQSVLAKPRWRAAIYSLSLAVYCSSWTFYGAVGSAVSSGWLFATIYLGPILLMVVGYDLMQRLLHLTKTQRITSIADFIAFRYGKGRGLAAFVTIAAVLGSLPYIALQLKGVTTALITSSLPAEVLLQSGNQSGPVQDFHSQTALVLALSLALFANLFGARRLDASEHHRGLVLAVAFESVVKLLAFGAVGLWALFSLLGGPSGLVETVSASEEYSRLFLPDTLPNNFWVQTLLAAMAIFCLPRQFHTAFVENEDPSDLRVARWLFPLYLALFTLLVVPIAVAGMQQYGGTAVNADIYVITLPKDAGHALLTILSFLGGFSAATGMVIMATVALATMVSNDLVLPLLLKVRKRSHGNFSKTLLMSRRCTIFVLALIAWGYYLLIEESRALAALGLVSFAAAAQFAPALVAGVYWRGASRAGAVSGLVAGFVSWLVFILIPPYLPTHWSWANVDFGNAVWLSLGLNCAGLVIGSLWSRQRQISLPDVLSAHGKGNVTVQELRRLAAYFIGSQRVEEAFRSVMPASNTAAWAQNAPADGGLINFTERLLAGCIGAASARAVMTTGLRGEQVSGRETLSLLEQTSSAIQFNRELLEATLDNISQGVSVVDVDLRLVSWNRAYLELLNYPPGVVYVGRPLEELIRYNVERGLCGPGNVEERVNRRMYHVRRGTPYTHERIQPDGRVVEIRGSPMPTGGYVTTYTDVTHYKKTEQALRASEKRIRFYTDNAPALLAYVDRELCYRFANRAYRELVGVKEGTLDGEHVESVLSPRALTQRSPYIDGVLRGERQHFELALADQDGEQAGDETYALATYIPDFDSDGQVRGFFAVLQDISSRRRAELALQDAYATMEQQVEQRTRELRETMEALHSAKQEAELANQSKSRFLAAASHDLLQPLNAARLFASVLAQSSDDLPAESARLVRRVDHSLAAAEELLSALLDISRLDQGALKPEFSVISVGDMLEKLNRQFSELADRRGLQFRVRPCDAHVVSDPQLLQRVLMNLIGNALRYTRVGGVLVACQRRGQRLQIGVWDTGPGIDQEDQERIFQEFQRLDHNSSEKGLGLGLAICQRISLMLEAPMGVRSRPEHGSCFYISLPYATAEDMASVARQTEPRIAAPRADFRGLRVLCLDDDQEILEGMEALLHRWGCEVMLAQTFEEALKVSAHTAPELMLMDFYLGGGPDGLDVAAAVNQQLPEPVPVLMITADQSEELARRIRENGHQFMAKPVKPAALRALIRNLLNRGAVAQSAS